MAAARNLYDLFDESDVEDFAGFNESDLDVGDSESDRSDSSDNSDGEQDDRNAAGNGDIVWTNVFGAVNIAEFTHDVGPILPDNFDPATASPLDYFKLFIPSAVISSMTRFTNSYARWKIAQEANDGNEDGGDNRRSAKWYDATDDELKAYLGLNIMMGVNSLPRYEMYWAKDAFLGNEGFKRTMTCNRYEALTTYFHVSDRANEPPNCQDKLYKVRPIYDAVKYNCKHRYQVHKEGSIDEAMIPFMGRLSYKQYLPAKPVKRGIKVWMRCDARNAYLADFDVYLGKAEQPTDNGLGYDVVKKLSEDIEGRFHHLYFDNYFTSVPLMKNLLAHNTYACGTVRTNRKGLPGTIKTPGRMQRGESKVLQEENSNLTATAWKDKKVVSVLSTLSDPAQILQCQRREGRDVRKTDQPSAVHSYNQFMNGVDRHDQLRMKYSVGRFGKKHWRYLVWFLVNCSIVNAFIIYKEKSTRPTKKSYNHLDFRVELAKLLIGNFSSRKRKAVEGVPIPLANAENIEHRNVHMRKDRAVRCFVHKSRGVRRETVYGCMVCNVHLCREGCHAQYHNQ